MTGTPRVWPLLAVAASLLVLGACGDDDASPGAAADAGAAADTGADPVPAQPAVEPADAAPADAARDAALPPRGDGSACDVRVDAVSEIPGNHVDEGTPLAYATNPPATGPHYGRWAHFQEFAQPVLDGYLVHSMEHGAVVLFYKCEGDACGPIVTALRAVRDAVPTDPACDPATRVRVILVPRPALEVPVAAAAWGFIHRASCVDGTSLAEFIAAHYAKAPENFCAAGVTAF